MLVRTAPFVVFANGAQVIIGRLSSPADDVVGDVRVTHPAAAKRESVVAEDGPAALCDLVRPCNAAIGIRPMGDDEWMHVRRRVCDLLPAVILETAVVVKGEHGRQLSGGPRRLQKQRLGRRPPGKPPRKDLGLDAVKLVSREDSHFRQRRLGRRRDKFHRLRQRLLSPRGERFEFVASQRKRRRVFGQPRGPFAIRPYYRLLPHRFASWNVPPLSSSALAGAQPPRCPRG